MKSLYLWLNICSIAVPLIYSFHPKLKLYKQFHWIFLSIFITMLLFIPWDIIFTVLGVWGFNNNYYLGAHIFELPIEEWLFFICIPYACIFTHYALKYYFPKIKLSEVHTKNISYILILILFSLVLFNYKKLYTIVNFTLAIVLTITILKINRKLLQQFYLSFIVILLPFFIVNGILTGSWIENQVVWYNNLENLGIRMGTIPVEDTIYAYSMILMNLSLYEYFTKKYKNGI